MSTWVNFKELREKLKFADVLRHFGVEVRAKGNQHHGVCPLPKHGSERRAASFSVELERGIFRCFGCRAQGNVLEFAVLMAGDNPEDGSAVRKAAILLQEKFFAVPGRSLETKPKNAVAPRPPKMPTAPVVIQSPAKPAVIAVNLPLDFQLKGLDDKHPYFRAQGITAETVAHFGLGVASRGLLQGRLAIPLRDLQGRLIGYAGRVLDEASVSVENPKYLFPSKRERNGVILDFRKSCMLYNAFGFPAPVDNLIVVEEIEWVWWFDQIGYREVVATMEPDCSPQQAEIIDGLVSPLGQVWIVSAEGTQGGERMLRQIAQKRACRWAKLPVVFQFAEMSREEIEKLLR